MINVKEDVWYYAELDEIVIVVYNRNIIKPDPIDEAQVYIGDL